MRRETAIAEDHHQAEAMRRFTIGGGLPWQRVIQLWPTTLYLDLTRFIVRRDNRR